MIIVINMCIYIYIYFFFNTHAFWITGDRVGFEPTIFRFLDDCQLRYRSDEITLVY